ncbi:hypothetical protein FAES_5004 [Fibrella aestuarina BUZ 2]|uniref:Methane oxygenase PmoA n=1 Tax=Fibrella aestuarina BUZ 2 TaxID=1166018 RepID=I0KFV0_9BACT|nr:PmoA family protein [Fibrella aestuarina]CCH03003.1 hypothetical protein FAES_5004 [Fibrella aestuarina BUZ 2]
MRFSPALWLLALPLLSAQTSLDRMDNPPAKKQQVTLKRGKERVDVLVDGKLFTAYIYPDASVLKKGALFPILTATGNPITRGWPMEPRPGERVDHPHHVGMWFNYGDVNGHDFWNNSNDIDPSHKSPMGTIVTTNIARLNEVGNRAELTVEADWRGKDGKTMLRETTLFTFEADGATRRIDRQTTLTALDQDVTFKDNKEGMIAVRVARQLEHPSTKPEVFTDASGKATPVAALNNEGVTGKYLSAKGVEGDAVWGTRAPWVELTGTLPGNEAVSVTLFDHPKNVGYPTYWHARGYGLFAANPMAPSVFSNGKEAAMDYVLKAGKSLTFRHRLLIEPGTATAQQLNKEAERFGK